MRGNGEFFFVIIEAKRRGKGLRVRMREKNSTGRKVFIVAMLALPVLHWLIFLALCQFQFVHIGVSNAENV